MRYETTKAGVPDWMAGTFRRPAFLRIGLAVMIAALAASGGCASPEPMPSDGVPSDRGAEVGNSAAGSGEGEAVPESPGISPELQNYMTAVNRRVRENWIMPASAPDDLDCFVAVRQLPNGEVAETRIVQCNGDETLIRSIEEAIVRSSPLPLPSDPALFLSEFQFRFTIPHRSADRSDQNE